MSPRGNQQLCLMSSQTDSQPRSSFRKGGVLATENRRLAGRAIAASPNSASSGLTIGMSGRRFAGVRAYAVAGDRSSLDCLPGASPIRANPMIISAITPSSSPRGIRLRNACIPITAA